MMVVHDLVRAYTVTGRLPDAVEWPENTLQTLGSRFGKAGLESVGILNSLSIIYDQQQLLALRIQKEKLLPGHFDAVWTSNELGRVYRYLEKLLEGMTSYLQAVEILESLLPSDDLHIIWTINCLPRTYRFQGKLDEALTLHQYAVTS
jgi:tetratricopeptide (TPR) repeat protein